MNTILKVRPLAFTEGEGSGDFDHDKYFVAETPFGTYEYRREVGGELVAGFAGYDYAEANGEIGRFPDAIAAQIACNKHFSRHVISCLEMEAA